jgi:hypothetical protein
MKIKKTIILICQFLLLYFIVYYVHIRYFKVDVVLYSAVTDGVVATLIMTVLLLFFGYFKVYSLFEKNLLVIIMLLVSIVISISIPTVIDRSLSFYILEKIQQHGGAVRLSSMNDIFTKEYIVEHRLMDIRITEQIESKTIEIKNDCVFLTEFGENLSSFSRFFRKNFLAKKRLIKGEYTNDLTDPFKRGVSGYDYQCK